MARVSPGKGKRRRESQHNQPLHVDIVLLSIFITVGGRHGRTHIEVNAVPPARLIKRQFEFSAGEKNPKQNHNNKMGNFPSCPPMANFCFPRFSTCRSVVPLDFYNISPLICLSTGCCFLFRWNSALVFFFAIETSVKNSKGEANNTMEEETRTVFGGGVVKHRWG